MPRNAKLILLCLFTTGSLMGCLESSSSSTDTGTDTGTNTDTGTDTGTVTSTTGEELVLPSQLEVITRED